MIRYLIILFVALGFLAMYFYNKFIKGKNQCNDAWASIDVQLKRRYDLIPNIVETVKGYASHEQEVLERITQARSAAMSATNVEDQQNAENALSGALKSLFAVSEAYPELRANTGFLQLQEQLSQTEDEIQMARRYYNASVREYNNSVETFPGNIFAGMFSFSTLSYFEIESSERENPKVDFS